jgi:hypothetical protein
MTWTNLNIYPRSSLESQCSEEISRGIAQFRTKASQIRENAMFRIFCNVHGIVDHYVFLNVYFYNTAWYQWLFNSFDDTTSLSLPADVCAVLVTTYFRRNISLKVWYVLFWKHYGAAPKKQHVATFNLYLWSYIWLLPGLIAAIRPQDCFQIDRLPRFLAHFPAMPDKQHEYAAMRKSQSRTFV